MCSSMHSTENCVKAKQVLARFFPEYADISLKFSFQVFRTGQISIYVLKGGKKHLDCNSDVWASKHGLALQNEVANTFLM